MKYTIILAIAVFLAACSSPDPDAHKVDFTGLSDGWNEVVPGGETACANGDQFSFSFRPGSEEDVTVYLQGGGACSNFESCDLEEGTFVPGMLGSNLVENENRGIFDFGNDRNPIADHSVLFIPYCTGDVFLGDQKVTYNNEDGDSLSIPHVGYLNTMTALNWMFKRVHSPARIAVLGSSAGAIATPLYAGILADHYPDTQINQLGDGAGAYQGPGTSEALITWQGESLFDDLAWLQPYLSDSTEFATLYHAASQAFDNVRLHQYNTESDSVQVTFVRAGTGSEPNLPDLIRDNLQQIEKGNPDFRSYTMTGSLHVILSRNELYQDSLYPFSLLEWVSSVINGRSVESVWVERE